MRRLITTLTVFSAFAAPAFAAPALAVVPRDLRSPDAQDAARQVKLATATDLRSPDARDAAVNRVSTYAPGRVVISTPRPVVQVPDGGFSWSDAAIGAASTLGLLALIAGTGLVIGQRKRDRRLATS